MSDKSISEGDVRQSSDPVDEVKRRLKEYGQCETCKKPNTGTKWCNPCNAERFKNEFDKWTSGNDDVDKFIREMQVKANDYCELIEWIDFDRFKNVEYLAKGGFGMVFKAEWVDGYIKWWCKSKQRWKRSGVDLWEGNELVCLKSLNDSVHITEEFFREVKNQLKFRRIGNTIPVYGITRDPKKRDFMIVMKYAKEGSLRQMLDKKYNELSWVNKLNSLLYIANGLAEIHKEGLVHKDFHIGNIVMNTMTTSYITDFGLCKPITEENKSKNIYGVLPYVAPEVLKGKEYTQASDVYSFGIIMTEVFTGYPPYYNIPHNEYLAILICQGHRPEIRHKVPKLLLNLINRCLDAEPDKRISAEELRNTLERYYKDVFAKNNESEIYKQVKLAEAYAKPSSYVPNKSARLDYTTNSQAIYTSRLLEYKNLPDPINAETKQLDFVLPDLDDLSIEDQYE